MARKKARLVGLQMPIGLIERDALQMGEVDWQATYGAIFGTREGALVAAERSRRNRRPFIVLPVTQRSYEEAKAIIAGMDESETGG